MFLASFCLLIPPSLGYGSDFTTAEIRLNGTYYETLQYYDIYAYYRVNCRPGDYLYVEVEVNYPAYDTSLVLYDEYQFPADSSSGGDYLETVYAYPDTTTHYYIRVDRVGPTGEIPFTLYISGATGLAIPGFEIISLVIGTISVIGVIYLHVKRKKKTTF